MYSDQQEVYVAPAPIPISNPPPPPKRYTTVLIVVGIIVCLIIVAAISVPLIIMAINQDETITIPAFRGGDQKKYAENLERIVRGKVMPAMKKICGSNYRAQRADQVTCLVHGSQNSESWTMPEADSHYTLWTAAILSDYESKFRFYWALLYAAIGSDSGKQSWIGIFTVENPGQCEYIKQEGGQKLVQTHTDKATYRVGYGDPNSEFDNLSYPGYLNWPPDAWIYPANAARKCGIKLQKKFRLKVEV